MQKLIRGRRTWNLMDIRRKPPTLNHLQGVLRLTQHPGSVAEHRRNHHFDSAINVGLFSRPGRVSRLDDPDAAWFRNRSDKSKKRKASYFDTKAFRRHYNDS
ncbi:hypothetical protein TRVL_05589 [Trypanosoma vivax]|uniref:Uncharacterized protein n=1 Tax=Trypanosoma vivax (strain Y486) TaxID=1055687 RepID=G0U0L4_TRYVY|nr:hypothetical protein TRVL_05589 [Trypanosoma vivax]CCC49613.1 hypothetical protein TVY486_0802220 [Trypanosoma vivax Y486]